MKASELNFVKNVDDAKEALVESLIHQGMIGTRKPYSHARSLNFAASIRPSEVMARLRDLEDFQCFSEHESSVLLVGEKGIVSMGGNYKQDYSSIYGSVKGHSLADVEAVSAMMADLFRDVMLNDPMFTIYWTVAVGRGETRVITVEERATDVLHDACYPWLGSVNDFAAEYLADDSPVLILQGPPGTGKTRLVRYILGEAARKDVHGKPGTPGHRGRGNYPDGYTQSRVGVMYTNDTDVLGQGKIFAEFLTGDAQFLVVEDADHLLRPRADGNDKLHYFLSAADGIVRAQGRKIIFTTNLPNISDIDDALMRPGRCFARRELGRLSPTQAEAAVRAIYGENINFFTEKKSVSLAEVYAWGRKNNLKAAA